MRISTTCVWRRALLISLMGVCAVRTFAVSGQPRILIRPVLPSDEVLIYTHDVVADYGADNTGRQDCTAAFQRALDEAGKDNGGIVFAPAGRYKFLGHLTIPQGVVLMGEWQNPDEHPAAAGTILCPCEKGMTPFITMLPSTTVKKLSIWYPEQSFAAPVPYPWTFWVRGLNYHGFEDLTLYNAYQGFNEGGTVEGTPGNVKRADFGWSGCDTIRNVYGTFLSLGIYETNNGGGSLFSNVRMSPKYWIGSGLPGAPASAADARALRAYTRDHVTGLKAYGESTDEYFTHLDETQYHRFLIEDAKVGIDFQVNWSEIIDVVMNNVKVGIDLRLTSGRPTKASHGWIVSYGVAVVAGTINVLPGPDTCGVRFRPDSANRFVAIQGLTIGGRPHRAIDYDGSPIDGLNLMKCTFLDWDDCAIEARSGSAMIEACTFGKDGVQIRLGERVRAAAILGNRWPSGGRKIVNESPSRQIKIDDAPLNIPDLPASLTRYQYVPMIKPPRPDNFFDVTAAPYGAVKGRKQDCTAAIQKALDDAGAAGGGTVFVPGGAWRLDGALTIPGGVELRGISAIPHNTGGIATGTNLCSYANKGNEDGTPFITIQPGGRVNGFFVFYPEMTLDGATRYPWTIRGAGSGIYIRNVTFTNSWRGLDLGTHRCDNFKVAGCSGSTKDIHIYIGGGSRHWALESCWNVWSFDADYPSPVDGHIINFAERAKVSGSTVARIPFKLGECTDGTVFDTEVFNPAGEYFDAAGKPLGIAGKVAMRLGVEGRGVRRVDFMLLKHDVCKGFVLTRGDAINMVMPHDTLEWSVVEPTFTGTLNQFMAQCWSQGIWGAFTQVDGGTVNVYQGYGARQIDVNGGTTRLFGLMFAGGFRSHPPYRGILENVLVGPGATRVEVTGCASSTGEEVTAANKAAPDRLAVRDCIGSGEPTAEASALRQ